LLGHVALRQTLLIVHLQPLELRDSTAHCYLRCHILYQVVVSNTDY